MSPFTRYPIFTLGVSAGNSDQRGITEGEGTETQTEKKIWTDADVRAIDNDYTNRETAYKIDALTRLILNIERFSILGDYTLRSSDDEANKELITEIEDWLEDLNVLSTFRASFNPVKIHGSTHFQKLYDVTKETKLKSEPTGIRGLQQLIGVEKYTNPFDSTDFYFYQKKNVKSDWKNPGDDKTEEKKVWFIKDGEKGKTNYTAITGTDIVVNADNIFEIRNDESGDSAIASCLNEIYIKNLIMLNLPNLIMLVVAPGIKASYQTREQDGKSRVPEYPSEALKTSNLAKYTEQLADYEAFKTNMQTMVNNLTNDWYQKGVMAFPDNLDVNVIESGNALNPSMLDTIVTLLNTEIAFALGFPLALVTSSGTELATARNIQETMAGVLKGIQDQYERITQKLIYEQFPAAQDAEIKFVLAPLTPKDAKQLAEIDKLHSDILEVFKKIGANDDDLRALATRYELLDEMNLGGEGLQQGVSSSTTPYNSNQIHGVMKVVENIVAMQEAAAISMEAPG